MKLIPRELVQSWHVRYLASISLFPQNTNNNVKLLSSLYFRRTYVSISYGSDR